MLRKLYFLFFLLFCFTLFYGHDTYGQNKRKKRELRHTSKKIANFTGKAVKFDSRKRYNGLGLNLSSMNYFGDITPKPKFISTDLQFTRPQIGLTFMRRVSPRISVRGSFSWGRIQGDDFYSADSTDGNAKFRWVRNLHFRNDIKELSVVGVLDLLENRGNYLRRVEFTPYVFGGIAAFHHNPKAKAPENLTGDLEQYSGKWIALQPLATEGQGWLEEEGRKKKKYSNLQLSLPVGVGVRYRINDALDLSFEIGYRYTFTDYLDDVSGNYVLQDQFTQSDQSNATLAMIMADRSGEGSNARTGKPRSLDEGSVVMTTAPNGYDQSVGNKRGTPNKDVYIVTGFHLTYVFVGNGIFGGNKRNAKFR